MIATTETNNHAGRDVRLLSRVSGLVDEAGLVGLLGEPPNLPGVGAAAAILSFLSHMQSAS